MTSLAWLPIAQQADRLRFEWGRIQSNSDWILPVIAFLVAATFVRFMYRRDAQELRLGWRWALTGLRTAAMFGLLILYLEPRWRTEHEVVHPSRVVMLVDTSLSMGLTDAEPQAKPANASKAPESSAAQGLSRSRHVAASLVDTDFLRRLRTTHEVIVLRFDEAVVRVATLGKIAQESENGDALGERSPGNASAVGGDLAEASVDWEKALKPIGKETRLGQSLQQVIADQRGAPLSGIVMVTDGCQNAGPPPETAVELAREARVPVFAVGVGSARGAASVRVYELEAPERAHPGDPYPVSGLIQSQGLAGKPAAVQLLLRDSAKGSEQLLDTRQIVLGTDGASVPVKFQVTPTEVGRRQVVLRVVPPPAAARNPADNQREADVEIVERKNHVLLFAGGPGREYQFVKSLLYRDTSTTLDVLLQTGRPGISQEAAKVLDRFPDTRQSMYAYDCVVAIDPQWQALNASQIDLLESWVGEQGGGLLVAAGPVNTGQTVNGWLQNPAMAKIRALYPVEFQRRATATESETHASKDPWPLDFTREGQEAEFLWLADTDAESRQAWASFPGVYSFQPARGPKPGATVFARFSDPQAGQGSQQPPYFVGQFYGSGSVFYMASGEMWRIRRIDDRYFDQFYTRLVRRVSQGRMLRQSHRGSLLVDKERYLLGNTAEIRAQLTDAQLKPLRATSVTLDVILPNRGVQSVTLRPDSTREGMFAGQLTVLQEGVYRLELPVPQSDRERIVRRIQVRLPDLERENPQRNDALLSRVAAASGGKYYNGVDAAWGPESSDPLADHLKDRTRISVVTSGPNPESERPWLQTMMLVLCGLLCGEWLIRRLLKLA